MDSEFESEVETSTNTQSSYESLLFNQDGSCKSPESSDCEGYATPLATSLTDISNNGITIHLPFDSNENALLKSGELTPVSTRAISPPIIRETLYLQKPTILVMTQRQISEENLCQMAETASVASEEEEEEFYDVAETQIQNVAQQLLNGAVMSSIVEDEKTRGATQCDLEKMEEMEDVDDLKVVTSSIIEKVADIEPVTAKEKEPSEVIQVEENFQPFKVECLQTKGEVELQIVVEAAGGKESVTGTDEMLPATLEIVPVEAAGMEDQSVHVGDVSEVESVNVDEQSVAIEPVPLVDVDAVEIDVVLLVETNSSKLKDAIDMENPKLLTKIVEEIAEVPKDAGQLIFNSTPEFDSSLVEVATKLEEAMEKQTVFVDLASEVDEVDPEQIFPESEASVNVEEQTVTVEPVPEIAKTVDVEYAEIDSIEPARVILDSDFRGFVSSVTAVAQEEEEKEAVQFENQTVAVDIAPDVEQASSARVEKKEKKEESTIDETACTIQVDEIKVDFAPEEVETDAPSAVENQEVEKPEMIQDDIEELPTVFVREEPYITVYHSAQEPILQLETPANQEINQINKTNETLPVVISDVIKTSLANNDDDDLLSDSSTHEVNADFDANCEVDGYSSGKEESLSSSTSTESFEFTESVPSPNLADKNTQALRNSIIERYPSHETYDDEMDSVDDFDDDLLAVKQISAEVEQLVAAINAFGRDEEQQMSAYLVGKNMAAEKKRKMDNAAAVAAASARTDQLVQTDNDFILVDRRVPEVMESLQLKIERLQTDLNQVRLEEKELIKINAKLQDDLEESQQTIDGIEVEAEQQYTELTSEIDELCEIVLKKDQELATLKEKVGILTTSETNFKDDVEAQRVIVQRQKEIIEGLREELDVITKKLGEITKARDKAIEDATIYKMKNMERDRFLSREAQMSMEIEDLQRELNKQKLILNQTSMAKLADTFDRKVLHLENELRERDMLICKQNQIINSNRKSPTGSIATQRKMQSRASVLAAAGNFPSAGSSSESFQNGLDVEAKEALLSFILSDRHNQLANIYNIGRILDLTPQEERAVERHLTKDRFT
uniref:GRIP domain-containing protein n=1 Tax=Caenorhabditis japonica TaxID=281687 RepID=A0A8R1HX58_CAEJA